MRVWCAGSTTGRARVTHMPEAGHLYLNLNVTLKPQVIWTAARQKRYSHSTAQSPSLWVFPPPAQSRLPEDCVAAAAASSAARAVGRGCSSGLVVACARRGAIGWSAGCPDGDSGSTACNGEAAACQHIAPKLREWGALPGAHTCVMEEHSCDQ